MADLHGQGQGDDEVDQREGDRRSEVDGIAVQLESWQQGGTKVNIDQMRQHLGELAPVEFYLEAIKGPGSE